MRRITTNIFKSRMLLVMWCLHGYKPATTLKQCYAIFGWVWVGLVLTGYHECLSLGELTIITLFLKPITYFNGGCCLNS